jgi:hypothetical protein
LKRLHVPIVDRLATNCAAPPHPSAVPVAAAGSPRLSCGASGAADAGGVRAQEQRTHRAVSAGAATGRDGLQSSVRIPGTMRNCLPS